MSDDDNEDRTVIIPPPGSGGPAIRPAAATPREEAQPSIVLPSKRTREAVAPAPAPAPPPAVSGNRGYLVPLVIVAVGIAALVAWFVLR